jgi:hypothetical protein
MKGPEHVWEPVSRHEVQESLGTRTLKDGTVHLMYNLAEPEGTGITKSLAAPGGPPEV